MAIINKADKLLSFGTVALSDGTEMTNTLSVNEAQTERMKVEISIKTSGAGGTSATFTLKGSNDNSAFTDISSTGAIANAKLVKGSSFTLPIPDGVNFKFYKVAVTKSGTFTAGEADAYLDTYLGL